MLNNFDIEQNFWTVHPDLKIGFSRLYKSDKSRNKENSSRTMWYVALFTDLNSKYINMPEEERSELLCEDYMNDVDFYRNKKESINELITTYKKLFETPAERHLRQWSNTLDDRTNFLSKMKYTMDNYEDLDKMSANTAKVFDTYNKIKDDLAKEASGAGSAKGGGIESLNDTGEI